MERSRTIFGVLLLALALGGCAGNSDHAGGNGSVQGSGSDGPGRLAAANAVAALTRADSCDDLLGRIHADVVAKIDLQAELLREGGQEYYDQVGGGGHGGVVGVPGGVPVATRPAIGGAAPQPGAGAAEGDFGNAAPAPAPMAPSSDPSGTGGTGTSSPIPPSLPTDGKDPSSPTDFSETNTQVAGVDEADIVKTDGEHIYVLHGNQLFTVKSWPAAETALESQISIEGSVNEMFVANGMAAVFSTLYDQGDLIEIPEAKASDGVYYDQYYGSPFTKVTLIDVTGTRPVVKRQLFIEGSYLSSRRHGNTARAVIQGGFRTPSIYAGAIEFRDPWGREYAQEEIDIQIDAWRDRMIAAVENTELSDWLPVERELIAGMISEPRRRCTDFYAPSPGLTDYGLTNVVAFDMFDATSELSGAVILGAADEVYSNANALVLAHRDYRFDQQLIEKERTVLHTFALDGADTDYTASGYVPGHIVDQFSLDERGGVVRASVTARLWQNFRPLIQEVADSVSADDQDDVLTLRRTTDNRVVTLQADGDSLELVGITKPLGLDGETIRSTRFVGDRGYVVTFETKDPLIVVDMSDPSALPVLGQLDIPGFSDYMHPIDDEHLVTIGRDTDASGFDQGLMLQIFDVSDPTTPRRSHTYKFGDNGYSEANVNHKAFTFHQPEGAAPGEGLLAFPYVDYSSAFQSGLEVFEVSTQTGFAKLGSISHTNLLQNLCGVFQQDPAFGGPVFIQCMQPEVRRGLFIFGEEGDFVYSVSHGGVLVHDLSDLVTAVATVTLPQPDYGEHRILYGDGGLQPTTASGSGTAGSGAATPPPPSVPMTATPPSEPAPEPTPEPAPAP